MTHTEITSVTRFKSSRNTVKILVLSAFVRPNTPIINPMWGPLAKIVVCKYVNIYIVKIKVLLNYGDTNIITT